MEDVVFFNELSIDPNFSILPKSKENAKELIIQFIDSCLGYILAKGIDCETTMEVHESFFELQSQIFIDGYSIGRLISELRVDGVLEEEAYLRFTRFVGDSYNSPIERDYYFDETVVYGLGEAHKNNSFALSIGTTLKDGKELWTGTSYKITKVILNGDDEEVEVDNISTPNHIFFQHEIWKTCNHANSKPSQRLLPNKSLSEIVLYGTQYKSFSKYYNSQQEIDITFKKKIGKIIAIVNGWKESNDCPSQNRPLFKTKNYYLAIDTENSTFEVYNGTQNHIGEIYFNDDTINKSKADSQRGICGKKTDK